MLSYGSSAPQPLTPSPPRHARLAVGGVAAGLVALCLLAVSISYVQLNSEPQELMSYQTPTLKGLLGTFMKEQGAKASDIRKMNKYYSSTKARPQMLAEVPEEFDPIEDADSNYGAVLGIQGPSRTNGVVPEDMDVSPEEKARPTMLFDVDGPQATDPSYKGLAARAVEHHQISPRVKRAQQMQYMIQNNILGTADKARPQMLDDISGEFDPITDADSNYGRVLGIKSVSRTNGAIPEDMDVSAYKAPTQMLDDISGEFDPITDADSNYGRVLGIKAVSRTNGVIPEDMDVSPQEDKARVQMLDDISGEFDPITDADSNYGRVLGIKSVSRTNGAIPEDMDVSAYKAPTQMLYDLDGPQASDGSYNSWKAAAKYDQGANTQQSLAQEIQAAYPQD